MSALLKSAKFHLFLKLLFGGMSLFMIYTAVATSLESNLFEEWNYLGSIAWMRATLWDFYFNIAILSAWVSYKEPKKVSAVLWILSFILLGSISTCFYVWRELMRLKPGDSAHLILLRRSE